MRKEVVIAIVLGIFVGLAFAFGIWRVNSTVTSKPDFLADNSDKTVENSESSVNNLSLTLAKPDELDVITQNPGEISGITQTESIVVISGESEDYILKADDTGSFSQNADLVGGINQLSISSISPDGQIVNNLLTVVHSTELEADIQEEVDNETSSATDEADIKEEKIQDKINLQKAKPKAYIGVVTDKTDDSLQIRNTQTEIQLVSIDPENISFVKINDTTKSIKYEDIAIGDFIAAMGLLNGNGVLTAKRIIVTDPLEDITRKIIYGKISNIQKGVITIKDSSGNSWTLDFPRRWKGPEKSELEIDQKVIVVGEPENENLTIRTIYITSQPELNE